LSPRVEPADLSPDSDHRPDIQLDLPAVSLLGDVTVTHPLARSYLHSVATRGVESLGDARQQEKDETYMTIAEARHMRFQAFVLYTYGGLHKSAMQFVNTLTASLDPATCLLSRSAFKEQLLSHIAISVQRGNASIMIADNVRGRGVR